MRGLRLVALVALVAVIGLTSAAVVRLPVPLAGPSTGPASDGRLDVAPLDLAARAADAASPAERAALSALAAWVRGDTEAAAALAATATAHDDASPLALYARAIVRRGAGDLDGAVVDLTRAATLAPRDHVYPLEIGRTEVARPDFAAAMAAFEQAVTLAPTDAGVLQLAASFYSDHALRIDRAVALARRAVALRADDATSWLVLGRSLVLSGQHDEAATALRRALSLDPGLSAARANLDDLVARQPPAPAVGEAVVARIVLLVEGWFDRLMGGAARKLDR